MRSVSSATQTCDNLNEGGRHNRIDATLKRSSCNRDRTQTQIILESDFERFDSCKKTIENFRTIREICDQMIGYFSQKSNSFVNTSPKSKSLCGKTFECLDSQIKKEN